MGADDGAGAGLGEAAGAADVGTALSRAGIDGDGGELTGARIPGAAGEIAAGALTACAGPGDGVGEDVDAASADVIGGDAGDGPGGDPIGIWDAAGIRAGMGEGIVEGVGDGVGVGVGAGTVGEVLAQPASPCVSCTHGGSVSAPAAALQATDVTLTAGDGTGASVGVAVGVSDGAGVGVGEGVGLGVVGLGVVAPDVGIGGGIAVADGVGLGDPIGVGVVVVGADGSESGVGALSGGMAGVSAATRCDARTSWDSSLFCRLSPPPARTRGSSVASSPAWARSSAVRTLSLAAEEVLRLATSS